MEVSDVTDDSMKVFRVPEQVAEGEQEVVNANEGDSSTRIMGNLVSNTSEESVETSSVSPCEMSGEESPVLGKMDEERKDERGENGSNEKVLGGNRTEAIVAMGTTADVATSNVCEGGGAGGEEKAPDVVSDELKVMGTLEGAELTNDCAIEDGGTPTENTEVVEEVPKKEKDPENPVEVVAEGATKKEEAPVDIAAEEAQKKEETPADIVEEETPKKVDPADVAAEEIPKKQEDPVGVASEEIKIDSGEKVVGLETESGNNSSTSDASVPPVVVSPCEIIKSIESQAESIVSTSEVKDIIGYELKASQSKPEEKLCETQVNEAEKSEAKPKEQSSESVESLMKAVELKPEEQSSETVENLITAVDLKPEEEQLLGGAGIIAELQTSKKENVNSEEATSELKVSQSTSEAPAIVSDETEATPVSSALPDSPQDEKMEGQQDVYKEKSPDVPAVASTEMAEDTKSNEGNKDDNPSRPEGSCATNPENFDLIDLSVVIESKVEPSNNNSPDIVPLCEATVENTPMTTVKIFSETTGSSDDPEGMMAPNNSPVLTSAPEIISPMVAQLGSAIPDIITPADVTVPSVVESFASILPVAAMPEVKSEEISAESVISLTDVAIPSDETTANKGSENEIKSNVSGACSDAQTEDTTEKPTTNKLNIPNLTLRSLDEMWKIVPKGYGSLAPEVQHKRKSAQPKKPRDARSGAASSSSEAELKEDSEPRRKRKSERAALSPTKLEKSVAEEVEPIDFWTNTTGPAASTCSSTRISGPESKPSYSCGAGTSAPALKPLSLLSIKPEELHGSSENKDAEAPGTAPPATGEKPADVQSSASAFVALEKEIDDPSQLRQRWTNPEDNLLKRQKKKGKGKRKQSGRENDRPQEASRDGMEQQQQFSGPAPPFKGFMPQLFPNSMAMPNVGAYGSPKVPMTMIPQMVRNSPSNPEGSAGGADKDFYFGQWSQNPSGQPALYNSRGQVGHEGGQLKSIQPIAAGIQSFGHKSHDTDGGEKMRVNMHDKIETYAQFRLYRCPNTSCKREWRARAGLHKTYPCLECETIVSPFKSKGRRGDMARCFFQCPRCEVLWNTTAMIGRPRYCRHCAKDSPPVFAYREKLLGPK